MRFISMSTSTPWLASSDATALHALFVVYIKDDGKEGEVKVEGKERCGWIVSGVSEERKVVWYDVM